MNKTQTQSHEQLNEFVKRNSSELIDQKATEQQLIGFIKQKGMQIYVCKSTWVIRLLKTQSMFVQH